MNIDYMKNWRPNLVLYSFIHSKAHAHVRAHPSFPKISIQVRCTDIQIRAHPSFWYVSAKGPWALEWINGVIVQQIVLCEFVPIPWSQVFFICLYMHPTPNPVGAQNLIIETSIRNCKDSPSSLNEKKTIITISQFLFLL